MTRINQHKRTLLALVVSGCALINAAQAGITYQVDRTIGLGSVVGTITTDGALGVLAGSDITAFNLHLNGLGVSLDISNPSAGAYIVGSDVTATAQNLLFNFSGTDAGILLFQVNLSSGHNYYCLNTNSGTCLLSESVVPEYYTDPSAQFAVQTGNQVIGTAVPEPGTLAIGIAGLGLLGIGRLRRH